MKEKRAYESAVTFVSNERDEEEEDEKTELEEVVAGAELQFAFLRFRLCESNNRISQPKLFNSGREKRSCIV